MYVCLLFIGLVITLFSLYLLYGELREEKGWKEKLDVLITFILDLFGGVGLLLLGIALILYALVFGGFINLNGI